MENEASPSQRVSARCRVERRAWNHHRFQRYRSHCSPVLSDLRKALSPAEKEIHVRSIPRLMPSEGIHPGTAGVD